MTATAGEAGATTFFHREGDTYVPTGHARGPWDDTQLHGGAPAALLVREIERTDPGAADLAVARLTYEFLGPVPMAPLTVRAEVVKPGRRFQLVEGEIAVAGGPVVVRVRAVRLRRGEVAVPDGARGSGPDGIPGGPDPQQARREVLEPYGAAAEGFHLTGMELRFVSGSFHETGPAVTWFRPRFPLIDDEPASPLARVAMAADFGNGISRVLDFRTHLFINTDLMIAVHREPQGEYVLLDTRTAIDPRGTGLAESRLHDEAGSLGISAQTLFVDER